MTAMAQKAVANFKANLSQGIMFIFVDGHILCSVV